MFPPLTLLIVLAAGIQAAWAAWFVLKDRPVILKQLWGGAVVEGLLVVQAIVAAGLLLVGSHDHVEVWELWGYLVTVLLVLPFAAAWAFAERTRWSSVVMLVAALTVAFLEWRLVQIWSA
ncbi:hypothetical protein [Sanguibacter sp. 25GB23B1]|uniref:hypothetical protein n=1 Tax=unclassified Sanguibacter TaxID=2645534 RepID=UPI0032AF9E4A